MSATEVDVVNLVARGMRTLNMKPKRSIDCA
mgnify:CR=1 FL=1|jgi:hypothetical protein